jgi:serine/threonine protein kinase
MVGRFIPEDPPVPDPRRSPPSSRSIDPTVPPEQTTGASKSSGSHPSLPTLAPPQGPGELGRLGNYRVLKVLGKGGMGIVYQAQDVQLGRWLALKMLLPQLATVPEANERFLREARAQAQIEHDHIVPIYQVGEHAGLPFLVMPLLKGMALDKYLKRGKALPLPHIIRIGREVARGLQAAHERGLIHRDIKPGNIWLDASAGGRARILDFGLARPQKSDSQLTHSGMVVGTPSYMPPEQIAGKPEVRSDLYSLGIVLYRMLSGRLPFERPEMLALLMAIASEPPPPLRKLAPQVPASLADLVMRLLAKQPEDRPASARELVEGLRGVERELAGRSSGTIEIVDVLDDLEIVEEDEGPLRLLPTPARPRPPRRRRVRKVQPSLAPAFLVAGVLATCVILAGLLTLVLWPPSVTPEPAPPEPPVVRPRGGQPDGDWLPLFNGRDLTGWKIFPAGTGQWEIIDGVLTSSGPPSHLFSERGNFRDFRVRAEVQINDKGNSGLFFRSAFNSGVPSGYEAQINATDRDLVKTGSLYPSTPDLRKIPGLVVRQAPHQPDEWFTLEVICRGPKITILVNSKKTVEWTDPKHRHREGHFAVQQNSPQTVVRFRKIEVQELPALGGP